jgi:hypothetical protein
VLNLRILVTSERNEACVTLVAGLLEATLLNIAIDRFPFRAELRRPVLTGFGFTLEFPGNGIPGVANDATFGGESKQSFPVVAHDEPREVVKERWSGLK